MLTVNKPIKKGNYKLAAPGVPDLLLLSVVTTYGEMTDEIQLGARNVFFSVSYGIWDIPEGSKKYVCLSLK